MMIQSSTKNFLVENSNLFFEYRIDFNELIFGK